MKNILFILLFMFSFSAFTQEKTYIPNDKSIEVAELSAMTRAKSLLKQAGVVDSQITNIEKQYLGAIENVDVTKITVTYDPKGEVTSKTVSVWVFRNATKRSTQRHQFEEFDRSLLTYVYIPKKNA